MAKVEEMHAAAAAVQEAVLPKAVKDRSEILRLNA